MGNPKSTRETGLHTMTAGLARTMIMYMGALKLCVCRGSQQAPPTFPLWGWENPLPLYHFFWTNVLERVVGLAELNDNTWGRLGSPRLPILLSLACLRFKAFKLQEPLMALVLKGPWGPHLNPASRCDGQLVQGTP